MSEEVKDTYRTLSQPSDEILFKEKNSKFFGYAFPVMNEDEVKENLELLKKFIDFGLAKIDKDKIIVKPYLLTKINSKISAIS